jgi:uncharacterized protein
MIDLQKLKEIGSMKFFRADDYIFHQDEPGNEMYIILSGRVGVYINTMGDFPIKVSLLESGDFLGEISLLDDTPCNATAIAETDTTVIAISKNNFQTFICEQSSITYRIMQGLIHQVSQLYNELSKCKIGDRPIPKISEIAEPEKYNEEVPVESQAEDTTIEADKNPTINGFGNLFPAGHKKYNLSAPNVYDEYLITTQARCPVCKESFSGKKQYLSKLKFEKVDFDFRKHYQDFEPLWYSLWVCPHCYYTNYYTEFDAIPTYKTQNLLARTSELKKKFTCQFDEPRTIDQVFTAYYLALFCAECYNANSLKLAKIWLQLSWLYHDVNDEEMFKTASDLALKNYYDVLYKTGENLSIGQAQQCFILLGELYLIKGDEKEAMKHFYTAIKKDGGKEAFNQQAEERLHDLRKGKMNMEF